MTEQIGPDTAGRTCPYCRFPFKEGAAAATCPTCGTVHHRECWNDNGGCAVLGCASAPQATPSKPLPAVAGAGPLTPAAAAPAAGPAPSPRRFNPWWALGPALVIAIGALAFALVSGGSEPPRPAVASIPTPPPPTVTPAATGEPRPALDPDSEVVDKLDRILAISGEGRRLADLAPAAAIENRREVLRRLRRLRPRSRRLRRAVATLASAMRVSIQANEARMAGGAAAGLDEQASQLKREFCDAFNSVAARHGAGPYVESSI